MQVAFQMSDDKSQQPDTRTTDGARDVSPSPWTERGRYLAHRPSFWCLAAGFCRLASGMRLASLSSNHLPEPGDASVGVRLYGLLAVGGGDGESLVQEGEG